MQYKTTPLHTFKIGIISEGAGTGPVLLVVMVEF